LKISFILIFLLVSFFSYAQDSTGSLAFKNNRPQRQKTIFYQPDLSYRIWQQFNLIKEANSGNPLAQHELGLRYLLGEDQPADTAKAVFWIRKAAMQRLPAAAFNYGILLYNGWGTEWNPFEAFNNFIIAAKDTMPQALYVLGILHTDNLIVKRDWSIAYSYVKLAADKGHKPASDILESIKKYLPDSTAATSSDSDAPGSSGLVFIDFDRPAADLSAEVSDTLLIEDLLLSGDTLFQNIIVMKENKPVINFDESDLPLLEQTADWGCPEAITLIGRLYEKGLYYDKSLVTAAAYYIRGSKMDSYRSTFLLYQLIKEENFFNDLKEAALREDTEAMFVWYGLYNFNLDNSIAEKDAVDLLVKSAEAGYLPAIVEMGLNRYTGKYFEKNVPRAIDLWKNASSRGMKEAEIRIAASIIYGEFKGDPGSALDLINKGLNYGSVLSQVVYGYALENNLTGGSNKGDEIKFYRSAAQRGSRFASAQLERRYNDIRPSDPVYKVN
jgi:uncharacterized protein